MIENTEKAFTKFREILRKNRLKENIEYDVNFEIRYFSNRFNVKQIRFGMFVDVNEISPLLVARCLNDSENCIINFAIPDLTLDNYDRSTIYFSESTFESPNTYNLDSFKVFLKFAGLQFRSAKSSS